MFEGFRAEGSIADGFGASFWRLGGSILEGLGVYLGGFAGLFVGLGVDFGGLGAYVGNVEGQEAPQERPRGHQNRRGVIFGPLTPAKKYLGLGPFL